MKKLFIIIIILLCSSLVFAGGVTDAKKNVIARQSVASGASCPADGSYDDRSNDDAGTFEVLSSSADYYYCGSRYTPASDVDVCKIGFKLSESAGDTSGETYVVKIWALSGDNLDTLLGTSDDISGTDSWSADWVRFEFSTAVSLTGSTSYAITIENKDGLETTNTIAIHDANSTSATLHGMYSWNSSETVVGGWATYTNSIEIYHED